ncbi:MAG: putative signal transducing protein [Sphingomonadales bacterium]
MSLVELHRFDTPIEAELARLRLDAQGIRSIVFDAANLYASVATGVRLMVDEEDKEEAEKALGF